MYFYATPQILQEINAIFLFPEKFSSFLLSVGKFLENYWKIPRKFLL